MSSNSHRGYKINKLIEAIKEIGIKGARKIEERIDRQYLAIKKLSKVVDNSVLSKIVVGNALICYQLSGKGEDYWEEFTGYFSQRESGDCIQSLISFLFSSKNNRRLREEKKRRLIKYSEIVGKIDFSLDFLDLYKILSDTFPSSKKTISFAVKMFGYGKRIAYQKFYPFPKEVPYPIDERAKKFAKMFTQEKTGEFFTFLSQATGVPALHLDSIVWNLMNKGNREKIKLLPKWKSIERLIRQMET